MQKTVYFDKYIPYQLEHGVDGAMVEKKLDLSGFFSAVAAAELRNTLRTINGERYRFHVCHFDETNACWEVQLLRLRDVLLPGVADEAGMYEILTLPEGRFIAESCTLVYDAAHTCLYMLRNKMCLSISRLIDYFREMFPEGVYLTFKPVFQMDESQPWGNQTSIRRIELCCSADQAECLGQETRLYHLLKQFGCYNGNTISISISMGHHRGSLNPLETRRLITEAYGVPELGKLRVHAADREDAMHEWINLLDNRVYYRCRIQFDKERPITHSRLYQAFLRVHSQGGH